MDGSRATASARDAAGLVERATRYAECLHRGQAGSSGRDFVEHPLEVARMLQESGGGEALVAAGVLHDAVEDTEATLADVEERMGPEVAHLVAALTEDASVEPYERRKAALRRQVEESGPDAALVYAADKASKAGELADALAGGGDPGEVGWGPAKREHYEASRLMLERVLPRHPLVESFAAQLRRLEALSPGVLGR